MRQPPNPYPVLQTREKRGTVSSAPEQSSHSELPPAVRIGHVNPRVADLDRATSFYREVLGFEVPAYGSDFGLPEAASLAAGNYHHHIGLNTWRSQGGTLSPEGHTGVHHFAILYPDRRELARAVERLLEHGYPIGGSGGPRGNDLSVLARPRRQRHRALLRPPERGVGGPQGRTVRPSRPVG